MFFFFSSRRRHTRLQGDWSSDVCSSDLPVLVGAQKAPPTFGIRHGIDRAIPGGRHRIGKGNRWTDWRGALPARRSEERRVGEEGRSRWSPYHLKKKKRRRSIIS